MRCQKCGNFVAYKATKCNNCFQTTGYRLGQKRVPPEDMFGNQVYEFEPDKQKEQVRKNYLDTLPEFQELKRIKKQNFSMVFKLMGLIFACIPICAIFMFLGIALSFKTPELGIPLAVIILFCFIAATFIIFIKTLKKNKPNQIREKEIKLHENKYIYYANDFIIGYSVLDHTTSDDNGTDYYYAFYEVDKRNIKGITYDPRYGEYILVLHRPVFHHYDFRPCNEFRIADIFDDYVLSSVLACDLPAKHMPY